jgi:hypothetical protein
MCKVSIRDTNTCEQGCKITVYFHSSVTYSINSPSVKNFKKTTNYDQGKNRFGDCPGRRIGAH